MGEAMSEELAELIDKARSHQMTPAEVAEQRISFAYGNLALDKVGFTREIIVKAAEALA
jgi:hypothetical protein